MHPRLAPARGGTGRSTSEADAEVPPSDRRRLAVDAKRRLAQRAFLQQKFTDLPIFAECSEDFVGALTWCTSERQVGQGEVVVRAGSPGAGLVVVLRGECSVHVDDLVVGTCRAGSLTAACVVGEMVLLGIAKVWQATVCALSACTVVDVPAEGFVVLLEQHPEEKQRFDALRRAHDKPHYMHAGIFQDPVGLFRGFPDAVLRTIDALSGRKLFFPGQMLMEEGAQGEDLLILISGHVRVEIAGKVVSEVSLDVARRHRRGRLREPAHRRPASFGDSCLLGLRETRSASVVAVKVCQARIVYKAVVMRALQTTLRAPHGHAQVAGQAAAFFLGDAVPPPRQVDAEVSALSRLHIFASASVSREFLEFLVSHLEDRLCVAEDVIVRQGAEDGGSLWLVSFGTLTVTKDDVKVGQLVAGDVFGETTALAIAAKRSSTVVADTTCYLRTLHQCIVMRGLELFPEERERVMYEALKKSCGMQGMLVPTENLEGDLLVKLISDSPLFCNTSAAFVSALGASAQSRIYMSGEVVVREGDRCESMFIVASGELGVFEQAQASAAGRLRPRVRIAGLTSGSVLGEFAALGISDSRTATIQAESLASLWEVHRSSALSVLGRFPVARRHFAETICRRLDTKVSARIMGLPLFADFPEKFRQLLASDVERRLYFPGQELVQENTTSSGMLVVNLGTCVLKSRGVVVKVYPPGSCFGSCFMLGILETHIGTLVCRSTCHVLGISRSVYAHALDEQPAVQASRAIIAQERQATKELQSSMISVSVRKRVWEAMEELMTSDPLGAAAIFEAWKGAALRLREERERNAAAVAQRDRLQAEWLRRRRDAMERVRLRRLQELAPHWRKQVACPHEASSGSGSSQLPRIEAPASVEELLQALSWPAPKTSKFYSLRVRHVLEDALTSPGGPPLLPLLTKLPAPPADSATFVLPFLVPGATAL